MSTALPVSAPRARTSRRIPVLAAASALVAASVPASAGAASAAPDRATQYRNAAQLPTPASPAGGQSAERFHHFR